MSDRDASVLAAPGRTDAAERQRSERDRGSRMPMADLRSRSKYYGFIQRVQRLIGRKPRRS